MRIGLVLLSIGLVLGLGEVILRGQPQRNDAVLRGGSLKYRFNPYQRDPELSYALRPNWETIHTTEDFSVRVRTNELGLRGAPVDSDSKPDSLRILFAGDSYAFGFGVEDDESFPARVGDLLSAALDRNVQVLNSGVPGWSSDQYMLYLRQRGLALEPDLLVVAIMQNDVDDLAWHRLDLDQNGLPTRIESRRHSIDHRGRLRWLDGDEAMVESPLPESEWLSANSQIYHWIRFRLLRAWLRHAQPGLSRQAEEAQHSTGPIAQLSAHEIQRGIESSSDFRLRYHEHLISAIERDAQARNVPVRLVLIGQSGVVYSQMRQQCAARANAACFDTTPLFTGPDSAELRFPNDGHWTVAAHERAARAISSWLVEHAAPHAFRPSLASHPGGSDLRP